MPRFVLSERQRLDLELILCGGFAPLGGFLGEFEYQSVVDSMHLNNGSLWPVPIVLDVSWQNVPSLGKQLILCDATGHDIAFFTPTSIYAPDKRREALQVYGTESVEHPGVRYLMEETGDVYLGGPVELISYSPVHDFAELRYSPATLRQELREKGWDRVVAFQTRNPIHRAHYEIIVNALEKVGGHALLHPVAGLTKEGDIDYVTRTKGYQQVTERYLKERAMLALLPLAMRMAGPREALWHALIRKNYGATHFIVGRDHAGPGSDSTGRPFYGMYSAQLLAQEYEQELGISIISVPEMMYVEQEGRYMPTDEIQPHHVTKSISGTELRRVLREGREIPEWFSFPEVIDELRGAIEIERVSLAGTTYSSNQTTSSSPH